MKASYSLLSVLLMLMLISSTSISLSNNVTEPNDRRQDDILNRICGDYKLKMPRLCYQILKSDPKWETAELDGLCQITIDFSLKYASAAMHLIANTLRYTRIDPEHKQRYQVCGTNFFNIIRLHDQAAKKLQAGDYEGVRLTSFDMLTQNGNCRMQFENYQDDPIFNRCNYFREFAMVVNVIMELAIKFRSPP